MTNSLGLLLKQQSIQRSTDISVQKELKMWYKVLEKTKVSLPLLIYMYIYI